MTLGTFHLIGPRLSEVMERELLDIGVPKESILLEPNSNSTYQQLEELQKLIAEKGWKRVFIVTGLWHIPRVETMMGAKFPDLVQYVKLVPAEEVLLEGDNTRWKPVIDAAYASE